MIACRLLYAVGVLSVYHFVNMLSRVLNAHTYAKASCFHIDLVLKKHSEGVTGAVTYGEDHRVGQDLALFAAADIFDALCFSVFDNKSAKLCVKSEFTAK